MAIQFQLSWLPYRGACRQNILKRRLPMKNLTAPTATRIIARGVELDAVSAVHLKDHQET
ncbi:MAG: hypothetical protein GAK37_01175 [Pseudomonas sp.]|nr:MAG: hypothetical protein GAK37_01175 [Pseudomonas sp.]